ncbi:unnamed protein product [Pieris brassicae]|uniref:Uncharacterized protein n=1 Tax=Pieris brassicae TaxID=7116 RepID=A0A9P0SWA5_PIEBR|nr:unnamed protein product [Pieris brassicae]
MISEFENLSLGGNNAASSHADPFTHTELTPEQQKTLIDIRRRKTELLLEIQVSVNPCCTLHYISKTVSKPQCQFSQVLYRISKPLLIS